MKWSDVCKQVIGATLHEMGTTIDIIKSCQTLSWAPSSLAGSTSYCMFAQKHPHLVLMHYKHKGSDNTLRLSVSKTAFIMTRCSVSILGRKFKGAPTFPLRTSVNVSYDYVLKNTNFLERLDERPCRSGMTNVLYGQRQFLSAPH